MSRNQLDCFSHLMPLNLQPHPKQMYDDGDDEMKRTIAKAWTESREKNPMGDMGGLGGL